MDARDKEPSPASDDESPRARRIRRTITVLLVLAAAWRFMPTPSPFVQGRPELVGELHLVDAALAPLDARQAPRWGRPAWRDPLEDSRSYVDPETHLRLASLERIGAITAVDSVSGLQVAVSGDGALLALVRGDCVVLVQDGVERSLDAPPGSRARSVALTPDGARVVVGLESGELVEASTAPGSSARVTGRIDGPALAVATASDGACAVAGPQGVWRLWSGSLERLAQPFASFWDGGEATAIAVRYTKVVLGAPDGTVATLAADDPFGREVSGPAEPPVTALAWSTDGGATGLLACEDGTIRLWAEWPGRAIDVLRLPAGLHAVALGLTPDGSRGACVTSDRSVWRFRVDPIGPAGAGR